MSTNFYEKTHQNYRYWPQHKARFFLKLFLIEVDTALQSSPYKVSNFTGYSQSIWTPKHDLGQTHELGSPQLVLVLDAYRFALMESVRKQAKKITKDLVITAGITTTSFKIYSNLIIVFAHYLRRPPHSNKQDLQNSEMRFSGLGYYFF